MTDVRVVGAGLSGLATAWYLAAAGAHVRVTEATSGPGGLIATKHVPEGLVETAARAFTWSDRTDEFFRAAGVPPCFAQKQSARRYILRNGTARRWPLTPFETMAMAGRAGSMWVRRQMRPRADESVAAWGTRVMGTAATTWLIAPALQGIYASPPDALSAAAIFGKRTRHGKLAAPLAGMGELIDRLRDALVAKGVVFEFGVSVEQLDVSVPTVICTNAPAAARLLAPHAPRFASALQRIQMVSLVTATAFFAPHPDDLRGFGVLFPRSSGIRALGALFNAEIFPGRSELRSETWIYGDLSPAGVPMGDAVSVQVIADRAKLTGRTDPMVACYVTPQIEALPVYSRVVLEAMATQDELPPTLAVVGNYLGRLGVSSLFEGAAEAVQRLQTHL